MFRAEKRFVEALRYFEMAIQIDAEYDDAKVARDDIRRWLEIRSSMTSEHGSRKRPSNM